VADVFRAGAASVVISPDEPKLLKITGVHNLAPTLGVLDGYDLCADALAIQAGSQVAVMATIDAIAYGPRREIDVRRAVAEKTGIDEKFVLVAGRHNHSSTGEPADEKDPACVHAAERYTKKVRDGAVEACVRAIADLRPAEVAAATATLKETVGQNRRARYANGGCEPCWNSGPISIPGERFGPSPGPDSTRVDFLCAREVGAKSPFVVLTSYASHIHLGGIPYFNSETVGGVKAAFRRAVPGVNVIYANKTGGDIDMHCVHPMPDDPAEQLAWYKRSAAELGRRFCAPILEAMPSLSYRRPDRLGHECVGMDISAESQPSAQSRPSAESRPATSRGASASGAASRPSRTILVNALRLGDFALASIPSELFMEYINRIHDLSPFKTLLLLGFNGSPGMGYMGTPLSFEQGGYETGKEAAPVRSAQPSTDKAASRLANRVNLGEEVVRTVHGVLQRLAARE
jgi:neutral ceramidase